MTLGLGQVGSPLDNEEDWSRLVDALRQQESGGGKPVVSKEGALGSLQLMPGTADEMLKALGRRDILALPDKERYRRVRFDRALNEQLGQEYLRRQLKDFGHPALALAAYNAGPGNVRKWLRRNGDPRKGGIDLASWVDKIPFAETRSYVKTVTAKAGRPLSAPTVPVAMAEPGYRPPVPLPASEPDLEPSAPLWLDPSPDEPRARRWLAGLLGRDDETSPIDLLLRLLSRG